MSFYNKTVLITGAANGIGRCLTELFAAAGSSIIMVDKVDTSDFGPYLAKKSPNKKANYYTVVGGVDSPMTYDILSSINVIPDIVINNAGIGFNGELIDTFFDDWMRLLYVNLIGPIAMIDYYMDDFRQRGRGHFVNISSGQAFFRLPTWGAYSVTKVALGALSEMMNIELKKYGIDVTTVYPFMVDTGFYKGVEGDTWAAKMSMKLLPYYSMTPERVAQKIFNAIKNKKAVEMVSPINYIGVYMRAIPMVANTVSWLVNKLLSK
jgi:short-subunit dehydrogenase